MTKNWQDVRFEIKRLYLTQRRSLEEVRKLMKDKHGFNASLRAYKNKIEEWGWRKYKMPSRSGAVITTENLSQDVASASSSSSARTRLRELEDMLKHQTALFGKEKESFLSLRESASRDPSGEMNVERIASARIERTIKSLELILVSVARQINPPAGFESCWKQQPMMLEDAHGTFIPIPLDVVVSWQIFDNILQSHFRILPGVKKVAKREYIIEDSATCTKFSRDCPWTSLSKAGLKIDMSMIFNDTSKTSVVCPKCDTISTESKGVMVQCKNPSCKMLFRTEEDEEQPVNASHLRPSQPRSSVSHTYSPLLSSVPYQDEAEDKPGLFKRVIMRVAKKVSMITDPNEKRRLDKACSKCNQQLEADVSFDLFQPPFWGLIDPALVHPLLPPQFHAQIQGTTTLPCVENQQARDGNSLSIEPADSSPSSLFKQWNSTLALGQSISNSKYSVLNEKNLPTWNPYDMTEVMYLNGLENTEPLSTNLNYHFGTPIERFLPLRLMPVTANLTNDSVDEIYYVEADDYPQVDNHPGDPDLMPFPKPLHFQQSIQQQYDVMHNIYGI